MHRARIICAATLLTGAGIALAAPPPIAPDNARALPALQQRLADIDVELEQLARYSLRSGVGAIGYRSRSHMEPGQQEWVAVSLDRACPVDELVLVPALWRDSRKGFQSDGFPEAFRVVAGTGDQREGTVVATYDTTDHLPPRIAPLIIHLNGLSASWVRIEVTQLSRRAFDGRYIFQLSELMVFSGARNVALRRPVTASSVHGRDMVRAWDLQFLVDGHMPYLMDAARGRPSVAYIASVARHPALALDLGETHALSEIHLHAVDQSDTVPQAYPGNLGMPRDLLIEGAMLADFSDAVPLLTLHSEELTDTGPVMMWPLPDTACRYVRIRCPDPATTSRFGFAEIELFSGGRNIALGKPVQPDGQTLPTMKPTRRSLAALTDGRNLYGNVLSIRSWMRQLARRHDLEVERPLVAAELSRRYANQRQKLRLMGWLTALSAAGIGFTILMSRLLRLRQISKIKERFAADLHDELGANIHTIGLLGDLAKEAVDSRDELLELLDRSRVFTERSGAAVRYCTNMLEAKDICGHLVEDMKRSSDRLLADLEHGFSCEGETFLDRLKPRRRIDLFFFYKECLINIIRHSGATQLTTRLVADAKAVRLTVTDNGHGLGQARGNGGVPASLRRRARLMGARVKVERPAGGGTRITLTLPARKWGLPW